MDPGFLGPIQSPSTMGCLATIPGLSGGWREKMGRLQPSHADAAITVGPVLGEAAVEQKQ